MKTTNLLILPMLLASGAVAAQDISAEPAFGSAELVTGYTPDPHVVDLVAGGTIEIGEDMGAGCAGTIAEAPDYNFTYTAGEAFPLNIYAVSDTDTTLAVNLPDGTWICNDDYEGSNPAVMLEAPQSGLYNVYVGTYNPEPAAAQLRISEVTPMFDAADAPEDGGMAVGQIVDPAVTEGPTFGTVTLENGFEEDPHQVELVAGGTMDAAVMAGGDCVGNVAGRPDVDLMYTAGNDWQLNLYVTSETDTTLVVNLPDGTWVCNDDAEGYNPALNFETPQSGLYNIWIGTYGDSDNGAATLNISEIDPIWE